MALTRNEIRKRLAAFAKEQQGASNERSQAQTFWLRFYECFGIRAESAAIYEQSVKKLGGAQGQNGQAQSPCSAAMLAGWACSWK